MQVSKNFDLREFVCREVWMLFGDSALWYIDHRIVELAQWFRDYTGQRVTINDWHTGGTYNESGLRQWMTTTGAKWSQHKFGRAADLKVEGLTGDDLRDIVRMNESELLGLGLTTVELDTDSWLHIDCRYTGQKKINWIPIPKRIE